MLIAHLSDLHLDGTPARYGRLRYHLDRASRAHHLLLTGDLTADGKDREFEELSSALADWPPYGATIVPGNHDGPGAWQRALKGPLGRFAATSTPGRAHAPGDAVVLPIDTTYPGRALFFRALGRIGEEQLRTIDEAAAIAHSRAAPLIIAMHHRPMRHPLHWLEGLVDGHELGALLARHPHASICCGHDHRVLDMGRAFTAGSVAEHDNPLRIYDTSSGWLRPVYRSHDRGHYLKALGWA